jgi:hypothetical protein
VGIDRSIEIATGESRLETIQANLRNDVMIGGPKCTYKDKIIPCFVGASPNASITSQMLADMLGVLDNSGVFNHEDGSTPFLLLDGHHSRFGLPFLKYIHSDEHKWTCCIGVPYGTHLWQVADSTEMNGSFKTALTKAKRELITFRTGSTSKFVQTDIVPLVRKAWYASFARAEKAKKAITKRGWNPLNYVLLDHDKLQSSLLIATSDRFQNTPHDCDVSTTIKTTGTAFNNYLNQFILDEAKKEGRKRKLEALRQDAETRDNNFSALTDYTAIAASSGGIAKHNIYEIGEGLLTKVQEKEDIAEQKKQRISLTKEARNQKNSERFQRAFTKYASGKSLTREDFISLINKTKLPNDTATGKSIKELSLQWNERKYRLDEFLSILPIQNEVVEDLSLQVLI